MRRNVVVIIALAALLLVVAPAHAITYGQLDGSNHSNVGGLVAATAYSDGT